MKAIPRLLRAATLILAISGCSHEVQRLDDSDDGIKARVEAQLRGRKDLDVQHVAVDVTAGVVTISGIVPSPDQIQTVNQIVRRTHGVAGLMNNLLVQE